MKKNSFKIGFYVVFVTGMVWFSLSAWHHYNAMIEKQEEPSVELSDMDVPLHQEGTAESRADKSRLINLILAFVGCSIGFGLVLARDISSWISSRAMDLIYNEDGKGVREPDYEEAEEAWSDGRYLEAIELLREYLAKNPKRLHAQLRIAEIYEKDLLNYLAAALEYEEVLQHPLPPKRWSWAAIHLCNLYTSKLNQPEKGIALLQTIARDYSETPAAEKACKRLEKLGYEIPEPSTAASEPESEGNPPAESNLPPGFGPRR